MYKVLGIIGVIILAIGIFALEGAVVMWLWNWIAVSIFSVEPITFWLGLGIMFVINFIAGIFKKSN
jgi:hypothetical protein